MGCGGSKPEGGGAQAEGLKDPEDTTSVAAAGKEVRKMSATKRRAAVR